MLFARIALLALAALIALPAGCAPPDERYYDGAD